MQNDIAGDIVTPKRLTKIRKEVEALWARKRSLRAAELMAVAKKLGREKDTQRGKEPTFVRVAPGWFPLSIPDHPGTVAPGTAANILAQLEDDIAKWEDELATTPTTPVAERNTEEGENDGD